MSRASLPSFTPPLRPRVPFSSLSPLLIHPRSLLLLPLTPPTASFLPGILLSYSDSRFLYICSSLPSNSPYVTCPASSRQSCHLIVILHAPPPPPLPPRPSWRSRKDTAQCGHESHSGSGSGAGRTWTLSGRCWQGRLLSLGLLAPFPTCYRTP